MNKEEIQEVLDELYNVNLEHLDEKGRKLFEAIMSIADERDIYKSRIDKAIKCIEYYALENEDYSKSYNEEEQNLLNILKGEDNEI